MLAALMHDVGKPATRTVEADGRIRFLGHETVGADLALARSAELRLSTEEGRRVSQVVAKHLRPLQLAADGGASRRAIYRFFNQTGEAGVDIVLLSLADFLAGHGDGPPAVGEWNRLLDVAAAMLNAYFEQPEHVINPPALLNGNEMMAEFGLTPGPALGMLLEQLREAQAAGEVVDRAGAEEWVRTRLAQVRGGPPTS
jgi:putative nucleotidyltransferase with HDIG domain